MSFNDGFSVYGIPFITGSDGQVLTWSDAQQAWISSPTAGGGLTSVETAGNLTGSGTVSNPATLKDNISLNSVTASSVQVSGDLKVTGTASIGMLNTVNQQTLNIGDKYITILSGTNNQADLDGAGILFGSGSVDGPTGDGSSVAHIVYRDLADSVEIFPGLKVSGRLTASSGITGSFSGSGAGLYGLPESAVNLSNYATLTGVSGTFTIPSNVSGAITSSISNLPTRFEVSGAITGALDERLVTYATSTGVTGAINDSLVNYATLVGVSSSFSTPLQVSSSITGGVNYFLIPYATTASVTGAINDSLINYATLAGVTASFTTPVQVSGAIDYKLIPYATTSSVTGAINDSLVNYATLTGLSASFTTPVQVSGAITSSITNFSTRTEVSGAITGALIPYAISENVSSSFATLTGVSGTFAAIDAVSSSFATLTGVSGTFATLVGVTSSFTTPDQVTGAIDYKLIPYAISENVSSSFATLTGVTASFTTPAQVSSSITGALTNYITGAVTEGNISGSGKINDPIGLNNNIVINSLTASYLNATNVNIENITASNFLATNKASIGTYIQLLPVNQTSIPANTTASYIYTSGSTNDLYFTQYNEPYTNTTRLRWLEGALNTGLLRGGLLSTTNGSTTFNVGSGSGLIINYNASIEAEPYPTISYVSWPVTSSVPLQHILTDQITYIAIGSNGGIIQTTTPPNFDQYKDRIYLGRILHQSGSVTNGAINTAPSAYGAGSNILDFTRAFGPLKISGHLLEASGSTTLSLTKTNGVSYVEGRNYSYNPNIPNIVTTDSDSAVTISKIYRQYMSGSTPKIDTGVANEGYTVLDPKQYQNGSGLAAVGSSEYSVQRIYWFPRAVNGALFAYYGQAKYSSLDEAIAGINTEKFIEGTNTSTSAILVGYVVMRANADNFANNIVARIYQAGLFRGASSAGGGSSTTPPVTNLDTLSDVTIQTELSGQALVYSGTNWVNANPLTSSFALNSLTASKLEGFLQSDYLSVSSFNSYTSSTNSTFAGTSSYALTAAYFDVSSYATLVGVTGAIDNSLIPYATTSSVTGAINSSIIDFATRLEVTGAIDYRLIPYATTSSVTGAINYSIANLPTRLEVTGVINDSLVPFATTSSVTGAINNALLPYALITDLNIYATTSSVTGAISNSLIPYANTASVTGAIESAVTNFATRVEVTGAIDNRLIPYATTSSVTGALNEYLIDYATLTGVSSSFTTPVQISGAITASVTDFATRLEITGALNDSLVIYATTSSVTGAINEQLVNYATLTGLSSSFTTPSQVSGAITSSIQNFATRVEVTGAIDSSLLPYALSADVSSSFASLSGVSASFATPQQITSSVSEFLIPYATTSSVTGAIQDALVNFTTKTETTGAINSFIINLPTRTEVTGAINDSLVNYATLAGVSASFVDTLELTSSIIDFLVPYATTSSVTGAINEQLINYATLTGVTASFTTPAQVSGAITASIQQFSTRQEVTGAINNSLTPYAISSDVSSSFATLTGVSASFTTPTQVSGAITASITNFSTRSEVSGAITGALYPYAISQNVSGSFVSYDQATASIARLAANNTFTANNNIFTKDITVNGTASIAFLNNINQQSLFVGDKYITIMSGSNTHVLLDGAGLLFGSGSTDITTGDNGSVAYVIYRKGNAPTDFVTDYIEIFPGLKVSGSLTSSAGISGSFIGDGSGLVNIPTSAINDINNYATLTGVSGTFVTNTAATASLAFLTASNVFTKNQTITGSLNVSTSVSASQVTGSFSGSGALINNITASNINNFTSDVRNRFTAGSGIYIDYSTGQITSSAGSSVDLTPYATTSSVSSSFARLAAANTFTADQTISASLNVSGSSYYIASSSNPTLRVTQVGSGPSFFVEDSPTPDTSGFIIDTAGNVGIGYPSNASLTSKLNVAGNASFGSSIANGNLSLAEGQTCTAAGFGSHAEGSLTLASGSNSHAEGVQSIAYSPGSHAEGQYTIASASYQHTQGKFNATSSTALMIVGNGTANNARSNILEVYDTNVVVSGALNITGQTTFGGGVKLPISTKTSNYSLTASSDYIVAFSGSNLTGTLPAATNINGSTFIIKNLHTSSLYIVDGVSTIDGQSSVTIYNQYTSLSFISDGTNWLII